MKRQFLTSILLLFFLFACESKSNLPDLDVNDSKDLAHLKETDTKSDLNVEVAESRRNAITEAVEKASPAVVGINITEVRQVVYRDPFGGSLLERFFGYRRNKIREYEVKGLGSGFLISPDGYILTNDHVAGNAKKIVVTMTDGTKYDAEIIGSDQASDITLLKIDAEKELPYIEMSDSDDIIIGEWAIALGNPFGLFDINAKPTVTVGVISNNDVNFFHEEERRRVVYKNMIQTDAAISSGNSGGPLVNAEGKVIGMNTMIFSTSKTRAGSGSIGIGFAIPINRVKKIIKLLKENEEINRNIHVGMEIREIDDKIKSYLDLPDVRGVVVYAIQNKGPADKAGLEPGDIIQSVNGNRILREDDYLIEVYDSMVGQTLEFRILRNDDEKIIELTLPEKKRR